MYVIFDRFAQELLGEELLLIVREFAEVLLTEPTVAHGFAIPLQVFRADAGALGGRDFDAMPLGTALDPGLVKKSTPSKRCAKQLTG